MALSAGIRVGTPTGVVSGLFMSHYPTPQLAIAAALAQDAKYLWVDDMFTITVPLEIDHATVPSGSRLKLMGMGMETGFTLNNAAATSAIHLAARSVHMANFRVVVNDCAAACNAIHLDLGASDPNDLSEDVPSTVLEDIYVFFQNGVTANAGFCLQDPGYHSVKLRNCQVTLDSNAETVTYGFMIIGPDTVEGFQVLDTCFVVGAGAPGGIDTGFYSDVNTAYLRFYKCRVDYGGTYGFNIDGNGHELVGCWADMNAGATAAFRILAASASMIGGLADDDIIVGDSGISISNVRLRTGNIQGSSGSDGCQVIGNHLDAGQIYLDTCDEWVINGNHIAVNNDGIQLDNTCLRNQITGNHINVGGVGNVAIILHNNSDYNNIIGNQCPDGITMGTGANNQEIGNMTT